MGLGVQKRLPVHHIELHMAALLVKIGADQRHEILQSLLPAQRRGMEFLVKQSTVGRNTVVQLGHGVRRRGGPQYVLARRGRNPVRHRSVGQSAVRSGPGLGPQWHIGGHGIQARLELASPGIAVLQQRLCIGIRHIPCKHIHFFVIVSELGHRVNHGTQFLISLLLLRRSLRLHHSPNHACHLDLVHGHAVFIHFPKDFRDDFPCADSVEALPVIHGQCPLIFRHGHLFFVIYQFFNGIQGIRHIGDAEALGTGKIIDRPALLDGLSPLNAVVHHTGQKRQGTSGGMGHVDGIVRVHQKGYIVLHLLFVSIIKFLKGGHVFHRPGLYADFLPFVPSVGEHQFQRTAHVVESRVVPPFRLARLLGLHTADDIVLPGILQGQPPAHQGRNDYFVIVISRKPYPRAGQVSRLHQ